MGAKMRILLFILFYGFVAEAFAQVNNPASRRNAPPESRIDISQIADGCARQSFTERDKICATIIQFRNAGEGAIFMLQESLDLGPRSKAFLAVVSTVVSGRIRIESGSWWKNSRQVLTVDRSGEVSFIIEKAL